MNILVIGGAGYIGSILVRRLIAGGYNVEILDDFSTGNRLSIPSDVKVYEGNFGDAAFLSSIFAVKKIDLVMLLAARISVGESVLKPDIYYQNNVGNTLTLLDAMLEYKCHGLIFSSSAAIYGDPQYTPIDEKHPQNPINPYGKTKHMVEKILMDYDRAFGLKSVSLRYFNAAGAALDGSAGESQKVKQNLIPTVLDNILKNRATSIFGTDWNTPDGTCIRDYVHVEDIAHGHLLAMDYLAGGGVSDSINLGAGEGYSVKEVLDAISKISAKPVKATAGPRRAGDPAILVASSEKGKKVLGWRPVNSTLDIIIDSAVRWHFNRKY